MVVIKIWRVPWNIFHAACEIFSHVEIFMLTIHGGIFALMALHTSEQLDKEYSIVICIHIWNMQMQFGSDIDALEAVQRRSTKLVQSLRHLSRKELRKHVPALVYHGLGGTRLRLLKGQRASITSR